MKINIVDAVAAKSAIVTGVDFGENEMVISYQEKRHTGKSAMKTQNMVIVIDTEEKQEQYMALQDDLMEMVDKAEVDLLENPLEG